jgi:hypothetical protein
MANPNLLNLSSITAHNTREVISTSTYIIMAATPTNSLNKLVSLYVANNVSGTVAFSVWTASGDTIYIAKDMDLPPDSTIQLVSKDAPIYLPEGVELRMTCGTSNGVTINCSYETMA